jgi:hypothetical protein
MPLSKSNKVKWFASLAAMVGYGIIFVQIWMHSLNGPLAGLPGYARIIAFGASFIPMLMLGAVSVIYYDKYRAEKESH